MTSWISKRAAVWAAICLATLVAVAISCGGRSKKAEPLPPEQTMRAKAFREYFEKLKAELGPQHSTTLAMTHQPLPLGFRADIVVVVDTSASTDQASRIDVDQDGEVGVDDFPGESPASGSDSVLSTDSGDTILSAELRAVRTLLAALEGRDVRVAMVSFAGNTDPSTHVQAGPASMNARVIAPLGHLAAASSAVDQIAHAGAAGSTDFSAAISAATHALCDVPTRKGAIRSILLVTDGVPSLPHGRGDENDPEDTEAAIDAAKRASACGAPINVFAIGVWTLGDPLAMRAVAMYSGGLYHPIQHAEDLDWALRSALGDE